MINISKAEKDAISARFPNAHIVRTMKQKSKRHRYYCEETRRVVQFINQLRGIGVDNFEREGGSYTDRTNAERVEP